MKFPSIESLANSFINTIKRFPFEVLFALAGTIAATIYINSTTEELFDTSLYTRVIMTANLGLLLSLAATLYAESTGSNKKWLLRFIVAMLAGCLIFIFNHQLHVTDTLRFFLLSLAFHLLVAFAAFTAKGGVQGFWQFNKTLFLRFLASVLYSGVLYLGLAAAISASKLLFNLNFHEKIYGILFFWIAGIFNTIFFLAAVPASTSELENDNTYPKGLKIFTQYVLIPLASVYVIILLAYEGKILVQWNLPKGLVSNLILGYAVFGILSILLIYPLRNQEENKWIKTYSRSFYFLLIPLLILLFLAIASRTIPYGITTPRYLLIVLALWLLFITIYFLLSRRQNIKIIPISLCVLALLSVYGPQSAFSVSQYSQRHILINIFKKYGAFKDGKFSSVNKVKMSKKDGQDALERVRYFIYESNINDLQPYIDKDIDKATDSIAKTKNRNLILAKNSYPVSLSEYEIKRKQMDWISKYLGLRKFDDNTNDNNISYIFGVKNEELLTVKGYDYILSFNRFNRTSDVDSVLYLKPGNIRLMQTANVDQVYTLYLNYDKLSFNVKSIADSLIEKENDFTKYKFMPSDNSFRSFTLPDSLLSFTRQTPHFKVTFKIKSLRLSYTDSYETTINEVDGSYLISVLK